MGQNPDFLGSRGVILDKAEGIPFFSAPKNPKKLPPTCPENGQELALGGWRTSRSVVKFFQFFLPALDKSGNLALH
jgi:hypothetical protein